MFRFIVLSFTLFASMHVFASDPMRPLVTQFSASAKPLPVVSGLKLSSILYSQQRKVAVINGSTVKVGDRVGGYLVKTISPTSVRLVNSQGSKTLQLTQKIKKKISEK